MTRTYSLLLLAAGAAVVTMASPSHAAVLTQNSNSVSFSTNGNQTSGSPNTGALVFTGFNAAAPGTLTGVKLKFVPNPAFSGNASLVVLNVGNTGTFTGSAQPFFTFSNPGTPLSASGTSSAFTITPSSVTVTPPQTFIQTTGGISGSYAGTASALAVGALQSYFAASPTISSYYANWNVTGVSVPTTGQAFGDVTPASPQPGIIPVPTPGTLSGQVFLEYTYTVPDPINPVPGPLPILGAGAAFGFSRKLRKRIRSTAA